MSEEFPVDFDPKYSEYESLLLERDGLEKEAGQIYTAYMKLFGELIVESFELKVECIKRKKTIAYYQNAINRGGEIDPEEMSKYLDRELARWRAELSDLIRDSKAAKEAPVSNPFKVKRSKALYRRLAKLLHPDLNPHTDSDPELQELWRRTLDAYHANNIKTLTELEVLARKRLRELGIEGERPEIGDIDERIDEVRAEIDEIIWSEPYTLGPLVDDEEQTKKKKNELNEEIESFRKYKEELDSVILRMLAGGGLKIYVD